MTGHWKKLGLLYHLPEDGLHSKLRSHTANPLPVWIEADIYRVYFSSRDAHHRSSVGAVDIDIVQRKVIKTHAEPFFTHGPESSFYADGVSIGNCYEVNGTRYLCFMGWQNPPGEHWRGEIGRLIVNPDFSLELDSDTPLMGIDNHDPISLSYPWVQQVSSENYHMWYGSTLDWNAGNGEMLHVIKYATSTNGHEWKRQGLAVPYQMNLAQAFSRPTVLDTLDSGYHMWFSYRSGLGKPYRIGYATSKDAIHWLLALDQAGIDVAQTGWDAHMIEYPYVFEHKQHVYMLYNGNEYGKSGFGLAMLQAAF